MRLHGTTHLNISLAPFLLIPNLISAYNFDCHHVRESGQPWDLRELGGVHSVIWSSETSTERKNTTFTLDICSVLKKKDGGCPGGTRVCAVERTIQDGEDDVEDTFPIAGELENHRMKSLEPKVTRLKTSGSLSDSEREGLRVELHGGVHEKRNQRAIIEFLCPVEEEGTEPESEDSNKQNQKRDTGEDGPEVIDYKQEDDAGFDTLYLEWTTEHACESGEEKKAHWGFFTWFLIIGFLATAAYLIFGSWLNYNRYGARGWDLLPHGDTIRDVPYLLKDWARRVLNTVQGNGSRGGYSAV